MSAHSRQAVGACHSSGPAPKIYENILEAVGRTPMVRINRIPASEGFPDTEFCKFGVSE